MGENNDSKNEEKKTIPVEKSSITHHSLTINGKEVRYTVTAGTYILNEEHEEEGVKAKASIFYIAYMLDDSPNPENRPITFSFNGGPGSSSVWMHLGLLGPKRVLMDKDGFPFPPPYELVDNDFTLLNVSDLVFIDPVSTGYSRTIPGEKAEQFHDVKKDIESVGDFIHLFTTRNKRWASPKFLIGESYGTTRAAGLSGYIQERHGMYLNGIMLISSILNFATARFDPGNDLPYILFLPTYTATAWYHKKLPQEYLEDLHKTLGLVKSFASNNYTLALMKGSSLPAKEREEIANQLSQFTGLSREYLLKTDLRINIHRFCKELLRDDGLSIGRLDSRFTGKDRDNAGEFFERDPSYSAILGPYAATFNHYIRENLDFENDLPYEILTPLYSKWKYDKFENQYLNVAETLREAIAINPALKVFVANGYFDFATPFFATEYTFNHIGLPEEHLNNITMEYYEAGHMMYLHMPSLEKLHMDLNKFINTACQGK